MIKSFFKLVDHFLHSHNPSVWFRGCVVKFDAIQNICLFISVMILGTTSDLIMAKIHFPLSCKNEMIFC